MWALRRELAGVHSAELLRQLASYGWRRGALALAGTAASFAALGLIESLALRCAVPRNHVPRREAMTTAFVANAFSQSIGLTLLTGAVVRLRAYARHQLDAAAVARTSAFVTLTVTLGLLTCGAVALLTSTQPLRIAGILLPARSAGVVLLLVVVSYLTWSVASSRQHVGRGRWQLRRPTGRLAIAQLLLSSVDWVLTAAVLFAVLPGAAGLGFGELLRAYLIAQTVGMASHVPGGAGVFEAMMLTLTPRDNATQQAAVVAALVMFRVVYYLLPLIAAVGVATIAELRPRRRREARVLAASEPMRMPRVG